MNIRTRTPPLASAALRSAQLGGLSAELTAGVTLSVGEVVLPQGAALRDGQPSAPLVELVDVKVEVDVATLWAELGGALDPGALDLSLLDAVAGHANVDAVVALKGLPRVRSALRLGILEGSIDFKALERSFHSLADAVLNFKVTGSRLELEKDIPFVPWDESTLVAWELDEDDRALAARDRVRLRRLLDLQVLHAGRKAAGSAGCYGFGSVALEDLDVAVSLTRQVDVPLAGGVVQLGLGGAPGVERLAARGSVRCPSGGSERGTTVVLGVQAVSGALRGLQAAGLSLDAARFAAPNVAGQVTFDGLAPTRVTLTVPRLRLEGVSLATLPA